MKRLLLSLPAAAAVLLVVTAAPAEAIVVLTQWNFNSNPADASSSTGSTAPSIGSGSASLVGGVSSSFATGSGLDPVATDNTAWNLATFPAASAANETAGAQFLVNVSSLSAVVVSWDERHSNTASRYVRLQYTTDGSTWQNYSASGTGTVSGLYETTVGSVFSRRSADLTGLAGVLGNANFGVRFVAAFDPAGSAYAGTAGAYGTSGTIRFDMVTVADAALSVPEPATGVFVTLCGGLVLRRRRR